MKRKKHGCRVIDCPRAPYLGGLCKIHFEEDQRRKERRADAVAALHFGTIDRNLPSVPELSVELSRLRVYWNRACQVANTSCGTAMMPFDEAQFAVEWCISLAMEIVDEERKRTREKPITTSFSITREWVWERFKNLDAGLRSNGRPRQ